MTQEEAIKWEKEIEALKQGETIQYYECMEWYDVDSPSFDFNINYRIKPEPELIPFDFSDAEKLMGKWIKRKGENSIMLIVSVNEFGINTPFGFVNYQGLLESRSFLNGEPCGKIK